MAAGVSDELKNKGFLVFGPTKSAAQLEISKSFMKDICRAAGIPTAKHSTFDNHALAKKYVSEQGTPIVVKADGLAAGKGVTVAMDLATAYQALDDIFSTSNKNMDDKVVIEEFMEGEEASFSYFATGKNYCQWERLKTTNALGMVTQDRTLVEWVHTPQHLS